MAIDISGQIKSTLEEWDVEFNRKVNNSFDEVAKQGLSKLKEGSPKKTGDYAKGWTIKREKTRSGINDISIHNKTDYQLTHLLENGHIIVNAKGTFGRTSPQKHIAPVEEFCESELPAEIKRELEK